MEHWNSFEENNGTIEFADMEQWNESLNQIENNLNAFKSRSRTKTLSNIINEFIKLHNELNENIQYSFIKQDNIDKLYNLMQNTYILTKDYYEKRNDKERKELFEKIKKLYFNFNENRIIGINFQIENSLEYILSNKSCPNFIENKMKGLSNAIINSYYDCKNEVRCCIVKKWIYIVNYIKDNNLCDLNKINDYDTYLFRKLQKPKSDAWLLNLKQLSNYNVDIVLSSDFILDLEELNTQLYKGIVDKSISKTCISNMFEFLSDLYIYTGENINSQDYKEIHSKIDEWMSYCINADDEFELSRKNIQLNEWRKDSFFNLCPKEKYNINSFSTYRYIDKLKSDLSLDTFKNNTYLIRNYKNMKLIDLINKLEVLYLNDNPEFKTTTKSFINSDYKKMKSLLNILLDGDIDFIKQNGNFQFSHTCAVSLNHLLNKYSDDYDYDYYDELIDQFKSELKKGDIKRFDCSLNNDDNKDNKDDPYNLHTDQFCPYIHNIIADLYNINTDCDFSDIKRRLHMSF